MNTLLAWVYGGIFWAIVLATGACFVLTITAAILVPLWRWLTRPWRSQ